MEIASSMRAAETYFYNTYDEIAEEGTDCAGTLENDVLTSRGTHRGSWSELIREKPQL